MYRVVGAVNGMYVLLVEGPPDQQAATTPEVPLVGGVKDAQTLM
jgi:hypothetical protein